MFGQNKPSFGSTGFGFGGGSGFGAAAGNTTGFGSGASSAFGATTTTAGTSLFGQSTGLFGGSSNTTTSGTSSLFGGGGTTFGQNSNTGGSSGFTFGQPQQQSTGTNLFGGGAGAASGTSLFSTPQSNSAFGAKTPGAFGSNTATGGLFGSTATTTSSSLFGGSTGSSLFNKPLGGAAFGATAQSGTTVKFNPPNGTDTMLKNGVSTSINTKHQCITAMKEYESKSLEELRSEDYAANRKGPQQQTGGLFGGFGQQQQQQPAQTGQTGAFSLFGQNQQNKPAFAGFGTGTSTSTGTSLFGQQPTATSTGGGLFGNLSKPAGGGLFGTTTTSAATGTGFNFGQTSNVFGQNQGGSLFGNKAPAFGTTATTASTGFSFAPTSQSGGLFGNKPLPFGSTATTAATTGFQFPQSTQAGGLFGASKPAGTAFNFPAFGTATTTASGGLFGASKPAFGTAGSAFSFNANPSTAGTSTFGQGVGGGLFGSQPAKVGFGFTAPNANTLGGGLGSNLTLGGLGQQQQQQMAVLPTNSGTQAEIQQQLLALAMSPYGDNPLFKNLKLSEVKREELVMPVSPAAQRAALNASSQYKVSPRPMAKLKPKPNFGKAQLFDGLDEEEASTFGNDTFQPRRSIKKLVIPPGGGGRSSRRSGSPVPSLDTSHTTSVDLLQDRASVDLSLDRPSIDFSMDRPSVQFNLHHTSQGGGLRNLAAMPGSSGLQHEAGGPMEDQQEKQKPFSPGHSTSPRFSDCETVNGVMTSAATTSSFEAPRGLNTTVVELTAPRMRSALEESRLEQSLLDQTETGSDRSASPTPPAPPHPCNITLRRPGYYTLPSLDQLAEKSDESGDCFVENFVIGREGYGNVMFPGVLNVKDLNLDDIIHFRRKEITIYPDDEQKPPVGEGLNRQAQVTLDHVWPTDKSTHMAIKDPQRLTDMGYQEKIERASARIGAQFVDYRPETGSWVFQVKHFSKYGLLEEDEEEMDTDLDPKQLEFLKQQRDKALTIQKVPIAATDKPEGSEVTPGSVEGQKTATPLLQGILKKKGVSEEDEAMEESKWRERRVLTIADDDDDDDDDRMSLPDHVPTSHLLAKQLGVTATDLQRKKASFFTDMDEDEEEEERGEGGDKQNTTLSRPSSRPAFSLDDSLGSMSLFMNSARAPGPSLWNVSRLHDASPDVLPSPRAIGQRTPGSLTPGIRTPARHIPGISEPPSIPSGLTPRRAASSKRKPVLASLQGTRHSTVDTGVFSGLQTRAGWGSSLTLVHTGPSLNRRKDATDEANIFQSNGMKHRRRRLGHDLQVLVEAPALHLPCLQDQVRSTALAYLEAQLVHSLPLPSSALPPCFQPSPDTLAAFLPLPDALGVWALCGALWGRLHSPLVAEEGEVEEEGGEKDRGGHAVRVLRREAVTQWIKEQVTEEINAEIKKIHLEGDFEMTPVLELLSLLSGLQLETAALLALDSSLPAMALLLSQTGASTATRQLIRIQLELWREHKTDAFIDAAVLRFYCLMSGLLTWTTSSGDVINTCADLGWLRTFAVHLWYLSLPTSGVKDALQLYSQHVNEGHVTSPQPHFTHSSTPGESVAGGEEAAGVRAQDLRYQLLCLFSDRHHPLDRLLALNTHTDDPLDHMLSWHLCQVLASLHYSHLSLNHYAQLSISYCSQLEALGLWHWGVFVLLHMPPSQSRDSAVMDLLYRHVTVHSEDDLTSDEAFLHERLLVPLEWIHKAKAVRAKSEALPHAEAYHWLKAKEFNKAHDVITTAIAAKCIINEQHEYLGGLLSSLSEGAGQVLGWAREGQVYRDYLEMVQTVETLRRSQPSEYDLEKLGEEVFSLSLRVASLPRHSVHHNVAQAEMAKKTLNLLKTLVKMNPEDQHSVRSMLNVLKNLPLPEDYALQELQEITHEYLVQLTQP